MNKTLLLLIACAALLELVGCANPAPESTPTATKDNPAEYTERFVAEAIDLYEREGREALVAHYNTPESVDGKWYVFAIDTETGYGIAHWAEDYRPSPVADLTDPRGYNYGPELLKATEEGVWVDYLHTEYGMGETLRKHTFAKLHDGLIFASGWYEELP